MGNVTSDPEEFRKRWYSHIEDTEGIKSNLPQERFDEVDELQEEFKELIDLAADIALGEKCWSCESELGGEEQERCGACGVPV